MLDSFTVEPTLPFSQGVPRVVVGEFYSVGEPYPVGQVGHYQ